MDPSQPPVHWKRVFFPRGKSGRVVTLIYHLYLPSWLTKSGAVHVLPPVSRGNLTFLLGFVPRNTLTGCNDFLQLLKAFGGLGVACWPLVPKFAGSNPAEAFGFLGRKNPQHAFLRRGSKAVGPMS